jgi:putative endonuclease
MNVHCGQLSYHSGLAAEKRVAQDYAARGLPMVRERWRGCGGEIDLIVRNGTGLVFVEVKKSRSFARAADRLGRAQMARIYAAASEFLEQEPDGQLTEVRFDVALIDAQGQMKILENALGHD